MKRIWMTQQQPFDFMPLKAGIEIVTKNELREYKGYWNRFPSAARPILCPKIYTTRTRRMSGEYYVVQGGRFKAKPVDPAIKFKVVEVIEVDFDSECLVLSDGTELSISYLCFDGYTYPELDLGVRGTTMNDLYNELLKLNNKITPKTTFYINKLSSIGGDNYPKER